MSRRLASAIELDSPSAMFPTCVGAIPRYWARRVAYGKACSDFGGRGQGRRRQDDRVARVARLFHRPQHPDPRLRHRGPKGTLKRFHPDVTEVVDITPPPTR